MPAMSAARASAEIGPGFVFVVFALPVAEVEGGGFFATEAGVDSMLALPDFFCAASSSFDSAFFVLDRVL